nr:hypothetical protein [Streptomyces polyasparticus]
MSGTAYDPPRALPLTASHETTQQAADPEGSSTQRPKEPSKSGNSDDGSKSSKPSASSSGTDDKGTSSSGSSTPSKSGSASPSTSAPAGDVQSFNVSGGRVVFEIHADYAELVSATPKTGWEMQIWNQQEEQDWIRVTFTKGNREVSVFCTWHDHAPQVEIDDP